MPSAKKQQRGQTGDGDHVGVFRHEEHGKLHGAVLGVVSRDQFSFRFRQIERNAVGFGIGSHQVYEEADNLSLKNIPARNHVKPASGLRVDDVLQAEASRHDQNANQ